MITDRVAALLQGQRISIDTGTGMRAVGGGDISQAWRAESDSGPLFLKTGPASRYDMFEAEAAGLAELKTAGAVRVPEVVACVADEGTVCLALEWLEFDGDDGAAGRLLGRQLANLHRHSSDRFGWHRDNTIGATPQNNSQCSSWIEFLRDQRLGFQLGLAADNGYRGKLQSLGRSLLDRLPHFFDNYRPMPSLLHGDLWGGNWASCSGLPVIFDPAVYYGDRETDIAMTRLFGGFGPGFYESYEQTWPLADGHRERCALYQLYHVLNHLNLFGRGYLQRAENILHELL